jgi:Domain of unknown function (DUF397)
VDWRKSSFSGSGGDCVEIRQDLSAIRDSKNPTGPTLILDLARLVQSLRVGLK